MFFCIYNAENNYIGQKLASLAVGATMKIYHSVPKILLQTLVPQILPLCLSSHFWPFTNANLVLENFDKNLGLADPPPLPWLGQNPKFFQISFLKASLRKFWHFDFFDGIYFISDTFFGGHKF